MKKILCHILLLGAAVIAAPIQMYAAKSWEVIRSERLSEGRVVTRTTEMEVRTTPGTILINTSRPVQVRVFSILGQLVSSETIPAGMSQLNIGSHGLFIVKAGDVTCKVSL